MKTIETLRADRDAVFKKVEAVRARMEGGENVGMDVLGDLGRELSVCDAAIHAAQDAAAIAADVARMPEDEYQSRRKLEFGSVSRRF